MRWRICADAFRSTSDRAHLPVGRRLAAGDRIGCRVGQCARVCSHRDEVQRGLQVLTTQRRDMPEQASQPGGSVHQTWERLTAAERRVLQQLSVFRGGFTRSASEQVADASLSTLSALADKSLLHWDPIAVIRFMSCCVNTRAVSGEHTGRRSAQPRSTLQLLCSPAEGQFQRILDGHQLDVARSIEAEIANLRAAWAWALAHRRIDFIDSAVQALWPYYEYRCRYLEGASVLAQALACLLTQPTTEAIDRSRVLTQVSLAWLYIRLGRIVEAEECLTAAMVIYEHRKIRPSWVWRLIRAWRWASCVDSGQLRRHGTTGRRGSKVSELHAHH